MYRPGASVGECCRLSSLDVPDADCFHLFQCLREAIFDMYIGLRFQELGVALVAESQDEQYVVPESATLYERGVAGGFEFFGELLELRVGEYTGLTLLAEPLFLLCQSPGKQTYSADEERCKYCSS